MVKARFIRIEQLSIRAYLVIFYGNLMKCSWAHLHQSATPLKPLTGEVHNILLQCIVLLGNLGRNVYVEKMSISA